MTTRHSPNPELLNIEQALLASQHLLAANANALAEIYFLALQSIPDPKIKLAPLCRRLAQETFGANPSSFYRVSAYGGIPTAAPNILITATSALTHAFRRIGIPASALAITTFLGNLYLSPKTLSLCPSLNDDIDNNPHNQQIGYTRHDYALRCRSSLLLDDLLLHPDLDPSLLPKIESFATLGAPGNTLFDADWPCACRETLLLAGSTTAAGELANLWLDSLRDRQWGNEQAKAVLEAHAAQAEARAIASKIRLPDRATPKTKAGI